jgi:hypothetical protein
MNITLHLDTNFLLGFTFTMLLIAKLAWEKKFSWGWIIVTGLLWGLTA